MRTLKEFAKTADETGIKLLKMQHFRAKLSIFNDKEDLYIYVISEIGKKNLKQ